MAVESSSRTTTTVIHPSSPASIGLLLARVPLGLYFIAAAIGKFRMDKGVAGFVDGAMPMATKYMSESLSRNYLNALPYAELVLGLFLIAGLLTRFTAAVLALLLISFTIAQGGAAAMGQLNPQTKLPFHPNIVFIGTALALMLCGPGWMSVDGLLFRPRRRWAAPPAVDDYVNERPAGL
jgi:uncharacterized membrane protein YphA (DoxX/SURF4 family)